MERVPRPAPAGDDIAGLDAPASGKAAIDGLGPTLDGTRDRVRMALDGLGDPGPITAAGIAVNALF